LSLFAIEVLTGSSIQCIDGTVKSTKRIGMELAAIRLYKVALFLSWLLKRTSMYWHVVLIARKL